MTTSRIRSKGSIEPSSRRPTERVTRNTRMKTMIVRRTRSTAASGQDGDRAVDGGDRLLGGVELDPVGTVADGRRVDLELQPDRQVVAGLQVGVAHDDASVARLHPLRLRVDRVLLHALEP